MANEASGKRAGAAFSAVAMIAAVTIGLWTVGGFWFGALAQTTLGEKVAAHSVKLDAHEKELATLQVDSGRIATLEKSNASLVASNQLIISGLVAEIGLLVTILGILWKAGNKIHEDAQHIRATGHRLASFMESARQVPDLIDRVDALPCMPELRCPKPNGGLHHVNQEGD